MLAQDPAKPADPAAQTEKTRPISGQLTTFVALVALGSVVFFILLDLAHAIFNPPPIWWVAYAAGFINGLWLIFAYWLVWVKERFISDYPVQPQERQRHRAD